MKTNPCRKKRLFLIANKIVSLITLIFFSSSTVFALPVGQQVVNGQASFNTQGNNLTITNSPNAIINWQGFSINNNEAVRFIQQSASSAILNRVIGQDPSRILGLLQSNGRVFLINPNGILFGQGARIDVNGLVASTLNLSNQDFLAGKYNFTAGANAGAIENQGTITTPTGGKVFLIAPDIANSGIINSPQGDITLAAGHSVYLVDSLDPDISVVVSAPADRAVNLGQIVAQSGKVGIYGGLISQKGIINADSAVSEGGRIFLKATKSIELADTSVISADGSKGGQIIAMTAEDGQISGTLTGRGLLSAQGDGTSGSGGFIETSAAKVDLNGIRVQTNGGNWLIDPIVSFTIAAGKTGLFIEGTPTGDISGATLSAALGSSNITILSSQGSTADGNGDIFVNDTVSWSTNKLTLNAYRNITINSALNGSGTAQLALYYGQGSADGVIGGSAATYNINAPVNLPNGNNFITKLGSDSDIITYSVINNLAALQGMNNDGKYALGSNITDSTNSGAGFNPVGTFAGFFDGLGHTITGLYINRPTTDYIGLFGQTSSSAVVRNIGLLNVNIKGQHNTGGLVGLSAGTINNSYASGSVVGTQDVAGLVGDNTGTITNSYSSATVAGATGSPKEDIGGLVGENNGAISNSYSTGSVTGTTYVGGLVGGNYTANGIITNSYSTGAVSGSIGVGGLVGYNAATYSGGFKVGTISKSYANATVTGSEGYIGGLVGKNYGTISQSYAAGSVTGDYSVGGLVGFNGKYSYDGSSIDGAITKSYAQNTVNGNDYIGGLVGENVGSVSQSYSIGLVTGTNSVGGLVGLNNGTVNISYWDTNTSGQATSAGGTGKTTAQMKAAATFTDWDFTDTWSINEGSSYPYLKNNNLNNYWTGSVDSSWTTAGNWSLGHIPNLLENVFLDVAGTPTITAASGSISFNTLWLNENLTIDNSVSGVNGNSFTLVGGLAYFNYATNLSSVSITGGTLKGSGLFTITNSYSNTGGTVDRTGAMNVTQTTGNLAFSATNVGALTLSSAAGNITLGSLASTGNIMATASGTISQTAALATGGNLTLNSGGAITQTAALQVSGTATLNAGAANNITLTNAANDFNSVIITSGKDVSLKDSNAIALGASTVSGNLGVTAGGNVTLNGLINAGTGNVTLSSGGAIINGIGSSQSISAGYLTAEAVNGIGSGDALMTGVNRLTAVNTAINNIQIDNTGVLTVSGLSNGGTGNIILQNIGGITTDASAVTSGGNVSITAHSPLTIGSGGVSAAGNISLEASDSDNLTINGNITSSNGNIALNAGGSIIGASGRLSAPNGTITINDQTSTTATDNGVANNNTVVALQTTEGKTIATVASKDDSDKKEDEDKKKKKEGGEQTSDDKKKEPKAKNYCN